MERRRAYNTRSYKNERIGDYPTLSADQFTLACAIWGMLDDGEYRSIDWVQLQTTLDWPKTKILHSLRESLYVKGVIDMKMMPQRKSLQNGSEFVYRRGENHRVFVLEDSRKSFENKKIMNIEEMSFQGRE